MLALSTSYYCCRLLLASNNKEQEQPSLKRQQSFQSEQSPSKEARESTSATAISYITEHGTIITPVQPTKEQPQVHGIEIHSPKLPPLPSKSTNAGTFITPIQPSTDHLQVHNNELENPPEPHITSLASAMEMEQTTHTTSTNHPTELSPACMPDPEKSSNGDPVPMLQALGFVPICDLNTAIASCKIRAAVTSTEPTVAFNSNRKPGQQSHRFSFCIVDETGIPMRVTCFDYAVNKFQDLIKVGNVFIFQNFVVNDARYPTSACSANFELVLRHNSTIAPTLQTTFNAIKQNIASIDKTVIPIKSLTQNTYHWILLASISEKTTKRLFTTKSGTQGQMFNATLTDTAGTTIRGTFFMDAVDKFFDHVEFGQQYSFSGGHIVAADARFSPKDHPFEIKFNVESIIELLEPHAGPGSTSTPPAFKLIMQISPRNIGNWPICARIINKSSILQWENERMDGSYFYVFLYDSSGVTIRATFFDTAVTKFYNQLQLANAYVFSGGNVRLSNFRNDSSSDYEIKFTIDSIIQPFTDFDQDILETHPQLFTFKSLEALVKDCNDGKRYDVLAIVTSIGPIVKCGDGREQPGHYCHVSIVDNSNSQSSTITLIGNEATLATTSFADNPVVLFSPVSVNPLPNTSHLTLLGQCLVNPKGLLADKLSSWWKQHPRDNNLSVGTLPEGKNIQQEITPIANLGKGTKTWIICGRVYYKSDIAHITKGNYQTQQFIINILDSSGIDILAKFETDSIVQKFYNTISTGKVYNFTNGTLHSTNPYNRSGCLSNVEICFNESSTITLAPTTLASSAFNFRTLSEILDIKRENDIKADLIAVVSSVGKISLNSASPQLNKCELTLSDSSGTDISLTVWGSAAQSALQRFSDHPVVGFFPVRIRQFQQAAGTLSAIGEIIHQPDFPQTKALQLWWDTHNNNDMLFS